MTQLLVAEQQTNSQLQFSRSTLKGIAAALHGGLLSLCVREREGEKREHNASHTLQLYANIEQLGEVTQWTSCQLIAGSN